MDTALTLLNALQALSAENPMGFALGVILVMVTEGLFIIGIISIILKLLSKPASRAR